ncbi:MAG: prolyl oligopeptidase family serine peptidase [Capsulimonadaceae bacterium]
MASRRLQRVTPRTLLDIKCPGDLHISPDGNRVAFAVDDIDWDRKQQSQHLFISPTSEEAAARQITHGSGMDGLPRWSPDGKRLAFVRTPEDDPDDDDEEGGPRAQVWVLPMDGLGGEAEKLTDAIEGVAAYEWLPDSTGIVYLSREPRVTPLQSAHDDRADARDDAFVDRAERFRHQIWRIDLARKKPRLVHAGDLGVSEIAVSPDGKSIAYCTNYTGEPNDYHVSDIWTVPLAGGPPEQLTNGPGGKYHPRWSPESARVYYLRSLDPDISYSQQNLYSVSASEPTPNPRASVLESGDLPHDITGWRCYHFSRDGRLFISVAVGTATAVYVRRGAAFEPVIEGDEHIHEFEVAADGSIAFVGSTAVDPPEVFWLGATHGAGRTRRASPPIALTDLNGEWAEKHRLGPVELVSWQSADGLSIEATLTCPADYDPARRYPLLVSLHGGPHARTVQSLTSYSFAHLFAAEGYCVLAPNYRGSEGYGNEFSTASRGDLGGEDFADILAGVDWAVEEGIADPDRLGVYGSSYGGYLVNWAIARTRRFRAAISAFGIFSLTSDFGSSDAPRWETEYMGGTYWERPEEYARRSPCTYAAEIDTPVLILHGDDDSNTFVANSQELYTALRLQNKTARFVRYPREGHGFYEPMHRLDEARRCIAWFNTYVLGGGTPCVQQVGDAFSHGEWEMQVVSAGAAAYACIDHRSGVRFAEVCCVVRDQTGHGAGLDLVPSDFVLRRSGETAGRGATPAGLSIDVLGQKSLAEGRGWRLRYRPDKQEQGGVVAAVAVAFRIPKSGGAFTFRLKDFPPVAFDILPEEEENDP